ncbi:MAG: hypothetical protein AB7P35_17545 [Hyphomonadaceae bacterium]
MTDLVERAARAAALEEAAGVCLAQAEEHAHNARCICVEPETPAKHRFAYAVLRYAASRILELAADPERQETET